MTNQLQLGTVYGVLLNSRAEWDAWAPRMNDAPYKAPPKAPVLYMKPANTWSGNGDTVHLPPGAEDIEVGATVAMVMGEQGREAAWLLMNDWSLPHASYFRPPVKFRCLDGFLGIAPRVHTAQAASPADFVLEVRINDEVRQTVRFTDMVRPAQQLLRDVGEFMTLRPGDALMLGLAADRPRARAGDVVDIRGGVLGTLTQSVAREAA